MGKQDPGKALLENAYLLETPDENVAYYNKLAETYDTEFANTLGYVLPKNIANSFSAKRNHLDTPVVDVGCGTGLLGEELDIPDLVLDGLDISQAMLKIAAKKRRYRSLFTADLTQPFSTQPLTRASEQYGAVLSSGTFTHGHLGPDALVRLLDIAKRDALFVVSVNKEHHRKLGFEATIDSLVQEKRIHDLNIEESNIYDVTDHEHSADKGLILSFRKAKG